MQIRHRDGWPGKALLGSMLLLTVACNAGNDTLGDGGADDASTESSERARTSNAAPGDSRDLGAFLGTWRGAVDTPRGRSAMALEVHERSGTLTADFRLESPFRCMIAATFVERQGERLLLNVSHTSATPCDPFSFGTATLAGAADGLDVRIERDPYLVEGRLSRDG